jgi:hypothetical protein
MGRSAAVAELPTPTELSVLDGTLVTLACTPAGSAEPPGLPPLLDLELLIVAPMMMPMTASSTTPVPPIASALRRRSASRACRCCAAMRSLADVLLRSALPMPPIAPGGR